MRVLGIIAEYDPFHRGHERHLRLARALAQPDFTYIALSPCVKQRGEFALLSPYDRAEAALLGGADAVFGLPAAWVCRDAEHYALGAVATLGGLGATHLAFGAESSDLSGLKRLAEMLEAPPASFREKLREELAAGRGYPAAQAAAAEGVMPGAGSILGSPNNILAVCYLRAIRRLGARMTPLAIPRTGAYRADRIDPEAPSASAVREALCRGDWAGGLAALPEASRRIVRRAALAGKLPEEKPLDTLILDRIRRMSREELRQLPEVSEGLEDRIARAASEAVSREELMDRTVTKRYTRARLSRIFAWAMMGVSREELEKLPLPEETLLLGLRANPEMTALWRDIPLRMVSSLRETEKPQMWRADREAWRIWNQIRHKPDHPPETAKVVTIPPFTERMEAFS